MESSGGIGREQKHKMPEERSFPLEPKTAFYDWLYINALAPHAEWLRQNGLNLYKGFTDIEFCQARSFALLITLMAKNVLDDAVKSPEAFVEIISRSEYRPHMAEAPAR